MKKLGVFPGKTVGDIPPLLLSPLSCSPDTHLEKVVALLKEKRVGSIVITDDEMQVLGIFTERDLLMKAYGNPMSSDQDPIEMYMTKKPKTIRKTDSLERAAVFMRIGKFRHLIITDEDGKLSGVLSIRDILAFLVDDLAEKSN